MTKPQQKLTQLELVAGRVVYSYITGREAEEHEVDEQVFEMSFNTLSEMTELLQAEKLNFLANVRGYKNVSVDSVLFTAESEDKSTRVETVMVDEFTSVELVQKQL